MSNPVAFMWDWREQPPMDRLAEVVERMSSGTVHIYMPETGTDSYVAVISDRELTPAQQEAAWRDE